MSSLRHILAATDLSDASLQAVDRGFQIANTVHAQYTLLHALGTQNAAPLREMLGQQSKDIIQAMIEETRRALQAIAADATRNAGVTAHIELSSGLVTYDLPVFVSKASVDLVLLGAQGASKVPSLMLGSTTTRLLRKSQCPILIVRQPTRGAYQRILIAIDFSPASEKAIRLAREIAPNAQLVLCHVSEVPFEGKMRYAGVGEDLIAKYRVNAFENASRQLQELARKCDLQPADYAERILDGHPATQMLSQIEKMGCDLVVVGKHGTHVTEELVLGSVTAYLASAAPCDVLVVFDKQIHDTMTFAA